MENSEHIKHFDTNYSRDRGTYEPTGTAQKHPEGRPMYMPMLYSGWGYSTYQHPPEPEYKGFSAQNLNNDDNNNVSMSKEVEFDRAMATNSEFEYSQRCNKPPSLYGESNYAEIDKNTHQFSANNSYMFNGHHSPSVISMNESEDQFHKADIMTLSKPRKHVMDEDVYTKELYNKSITVKLKSSEIGDCETTLKMKIQEKTNMNTQRTDIHLELTEEQNPLFLYT